MAGLWSISSFLLFSCFFLLSNAGLETHGDSFVPDYVLHGTADNISIDCESRYSVLLNGTSPGPLLRLKENQTSWIRVYNDMKDENLTVHWHGLSERTAPFSDGAPQASQWPIPPLHFFDYEVRPEIGDAGTYFYHSHVGFQAVTATGPLIVDSCEKPPYYYDEDQILQIQDYYNKTDTVIEDGLLANPFVWSGETHALLLNGKSGTKAGGVAGDSSCAPEVIRVKPGLKYRFRFIGSTAISLVTLGIEDHSNFTIIEADGAYTQPFETDHMQIASGQRFSTLFTAKSLQEIQATGKTSYWIQMENRERTENVTAYAILHYELSANDSLPSQLPATLPLSLPQKVYDWLEYSLQPLFPELHPFPPLSSVTRTVYITVQQLIDGFTEWQENGDVWQDFRVPVPYLVAIYEKGQAAIPNYEAALANYGWDPKTLAFPAKIGETLDIVWLNNNGKSGGWDVHPFHSHGAHFWDLGSGNGTYDAIENEKHFINYTPVRRDTTMQYRYAVSGVPNTTAGWRAWRVQVKNPGVWMMHCHILAHMIMGMQTAWVFGDADQIINQVPYPDVTGYLTYGSNVYGNSTNDPQVWHHFS